MLGLNGCGLVALMHDKMLGPISPAYGETGLHPLVVGENLRPGANGFVATVTDANPFRLYPPNPIEGLFHRPIALARGLRSFLGYVGRIVQQKWERIGRLPNPEELARLNAVRERDVPTVSTVLDLLGPPRMWIKRANSQLMVYGEDVAYELLITIGAPPGVSDLIPIPGVGGVARVDYVGKEVHRDRTLIFFTADGRLLEVVAPKPSEETED